MSISPALIAAIIAISLVGMGLSLTIPLLALGMEAAGYSAQANGIGTAISGVATLIAAPFTPILARKFGIRLLLLLALALGMASLLAFALVDDIVWWYPIRLTFGLALTQLFVVSEYAVGALAPPEKRGFWIGIYSTCLAIGFAAGPAIIALTGTQGRGGFLIGIGLFALAAGPILWAGGGIPGFSAKPKGAVLSFVSAAPATMLAALVFGAIETGAMGLLPVHALRNGLSAENGTLLVTLVALGNVMFQIPFGLLSDRISRDRLLTGIAIATLLGALALPLLAGSFPLFAAGLFVWGGVAGGLYMVGLSRLGARYDGADLAAANSAFVMLYAAGMLVGPPLLGLALDVSVSKGLFGGLAVLAAAYLCVIFARRRQG